MALDKDKLLAAIDAKAENAYGGEGDTFLSRRRAALIEAYLGLNSNPAPEGRSQVVDRSVFETIQTLLPSLVRIFAGSDDQPVKFMPVGPEDEGAAEQTTAYVSHLVTQKNPWEQFVSDWIHDALLLGNGYAMAYWDETGSVEEETYEGLTDDQLAVLMQDGARVIQHSAEPDVEENQKRQAQHQQLMAQYQMIVAQAQQAGQMPPPPPEAPPPAALHTVVVEREDKQGRLKLCVLPPEHCIVAADTADHTLNDCPYFEFRQSKTIADLREMGLDVPDDISDDVDIDTAEDDARDRFGEDVDSDNKGVMREVISRTIWIKADGGDGESRLYYVIAVGRTILHAEKVSRIHAVSLCPQPLPHRHPGMSVAETVLDLQDQKTAIKRGGLDNIYFTNNQRFAISDKVNLDDFLDSRPGGVVRLHDGALPGEGHIFPMGHQFSADKIFAQLEYLDQERQNRAGVSRYFSGTDAGAINKTATGTVALQNMAAQRVEHIARMFAPSFEALFNIVHELISKHQRKADVIKLKGQWINVDPASWQTRRDVRISVGVGAGNKDSMLAQLTMQAQEQMALAPTGIVTPENLYETMIEKAKLQGFANPGKFWTDPKNKPQQPQQPPPEVVKAQMQIQADVQKTQAQLALDKEKAATEAQQKEADRNAQMVIEKYKTDKQAETQLLLAQMNAGVTRETKGMELDTQKELEAFRVSTTPQPEPEDDGSEKDVLLQALAMVKEAVDKMNRPKKIIRDETGKAIGVTAME